MTLNIYVQTLLSLVLSVSCLELLLCMSWARVGQKTFVWLSTITVIVFVCCCHVLSQFSHCSAERSKYWFVLLSKSNVRDWTKFVLQVEIRVMYGVDVLLHTLLVRVYDVARALILLMSSGMCWVELLSWGLYCKEVIGLLFYDCVFPKAVVVGYRTYLWHIGLCMWTKTSSDMIL